MALGGCGHSSATKPAELGLEREDLAVVTRTLAGAEGPVQAEVAATKAAWPLIANGLPAHPTAGALAPIALAAQRASTLRTPALFGEQATASITGPGAELAGAFRNYLVLAARGWQMIGAALAQIEHGPPAAARFARANVNLYIESVYDAHFSLAQIGKHLRSAYEKLGGATAFGASLTPSEVDALAGVYSEPSDRLQPHESVRLGG